MTTIVSPKIKYHLLLCATPQKALCCDPQVGAASWKRLKELLLELDLENSCNTKGIVLRSKVDCLRICKSGPILLVWPDGTWYGSVNAKRIETIVREHIVKGNPIEEWILKKAELA